MRMLLAAFAFAFAFAGLAASAQAASINDALAAYRQTRVSDAEAGFRAVYTDPAASAKDRSTAARELARIAWLVDGEAVIAKARLAEAEAVGGDLCDTGEMRARVLREAGERAAAVSEGRRLVGACQEPLEADEVRQQVLQALVEQAGMAKAEERERLLAEAERELAAFSPDGQAGLDLNREALAVAVMRRDARRLGEAWRGYFWLVDRKVPQALAGEEARIDGVFANGLGLEASADDQLALVDLLIRAGFFQAARQLTTDAGLAARGGADPR